MSRDTLTGCAAEAAEFTTQNRQPGNSRCTTSLDLWGQTAMTDAMPTSALFAPLRLARRPLPRLLLSVVALGVASLPMACGAPRHELRAVEPSGMLTKGDLDEVRRLLLQLPVVDDEDFADYFARAKARLLTEDHPKLRTLLMTLPRQPALWKSEHDRKLLPVLVGLWVRSAGKSRRVGLLKEIVGHATINARDAEHPGTGPAFSALEASLQQAATDHDVEMHDVEHIAFEFGRPWAAPDKGPDLKKRVAMLVHADVVPADEPGWKTAPFTATEQDGRIYGRGTLDDKGPLVASLSAVSGVLHTGTALPRCEPILVVGTSEETHWTGMERFVELRGTPGMTVVADAAFPVGVGEKGVGSARITAPPPKSVPTDARFQLVHLEGGQVSNQVPATAYADLAVVRDDDKSDEGRGQLVTWLQQNIDAKTQEWADFKADVAWHDDVVRITTHGKAAHSADPELGHNALSDLTAFLVQVAKPAPSPCMQTLHMLDDKLGRTFDGSKLGVDDKHPRFSPSTVNFGLARTEGAGGCKLTLNLRWPPPRSGDDVVASVRETFAPLQQAGVEVKGGGLDPFLIADDTPLVTSLLGAYRAVKGIDGQPVTVSGTTYAKAIGGAVTFGPEPAGEHDARMHAPNEFISKEELDDLAEMYAYALMQMCM